MRANEIKIEVMKLKNGEENSKKRFNMKQRNTHMIFINTKQNLLVKEFIPVEVA